MNISKVVSHLMMKNGLTNLILPFKDEATGNIVPADQIVRQIITTETVPIYSEYCPWIRTGTIDIKELQCVDRQLSIYMLPAFLTMTPVKYVIDVKMPFHNMRGTFGDVAPAYGINRSTQGVLTSQAYMMVAGQMRAEPTFEYLGFNKIRLYGWPKTMIEISVACEHESNLESIPESCYSSFMELATLDLEEFLYANFRFNKTIPTAHGNFELPIEDWQGAKEARKELLRDWDEKFHVDMIDIVDFM